MSDASRRRVRIPFQGGKCFRVLESDGWWFHIKFDHDTHWIIFRERTTWLTAG